MWAIDQKALKHRNNGISELPQFLPETPLFMSEIWWRKGERLRLRLRRYSK